MTARVLSSALAPWPQLFVLLLPSQPSFQHNLYLNYLYGKTLLSDKPRTLHRQRNPVGIAVSPNKITTSPSTLVWSAVIGAHPMGIFVSPQRVHNAHCPNAPNFAFSIFVCWGISANSFDGSNLLTVSILLADAHRVTLIISSTLHQYCVY